MWSCEVPGCSFWGNSVDMEIHEKDRAESHVRLLKEEREQLHEAVLRGDKNALRMRTGVAIASFTWAIDGFKESVAEKVALSQSVPFTSNEFHWDDLSSLVTMMML
ncbi:uncharacterized protein LOC122952094 [Acropora millepora]|uniref:uncharacterized protein LOC122952094 n=1 Tax=Acropora millepora TaxID=45264 RepID=UPI001CF47A06|nr:uncharacterized protein LOC122952094 [Acropora millepora]